MFDDEEGYQDQESYQDSRLWRPAPPEHLAEIDEDEIHGFEPAPDLDEWVKAAILDESGPLFNEDHLHLLDAQVGYLWTNAPCKKHGQRVLGMAEIPSIQGGPWIRARMELQLRAWFGEVPDFLITLDAPFCHRTSDINFCALVEHELYHCAQRTDLLGAPKFRADGRLSCCIKGHDVEEHIGVVRRYGVGGPSSGLAQMVKAANRAPSVAEASISRACGTCLRMYV